LSGKNMDYQSISELLQRIQATGLLRRYAPRNDGPKNRTVQRKTGDVLLNIRTRLFAFSSARSNEIQRNCSFHCPLEI
ncbi:hypothetical protein SC663_14010, partial [Legionella pneumophila serogroup 1]